MKDLANLEVVAKCVVAPNTIEWVVFMTTNSIFIDGKNSPLFPILHRAILTKAKKPKLYKDIPMVAVEGVETWTTLIRDLLISDLPETVSALSETEAGEMLKGLLNA
jgi:hypothetical protein